MLNFSSLVLRRGSRVLIENLSLSIHTGQRVGIVGRNGTGKSSLFAMIMGELAPDAGDINLPREWVIAHVRQETPALETAALDYVLEGDAQWCELNQRLDIAEASGDSDQISALHEQMHAIDGYTAKSRAARLLHGLGFSGEQQALAVKTFSGGWRMRLNLAQALMCRSDLLLLDEPTNHLDLDAVLWLQDELISYPGALLMISHDRDFLDALSTHILHIEGGRGELYTGDYSSSEVQRAQRLAQHSAQYKAQQRRASELQSFIDRFRAKATKARQAQSRIKQLERLNLEAPAHWADPFSFEFAEPNRLPAPLLRFDEMQAGYGDKAILSQINLSIAPGDRLALLGRNGAGKSTLMRTIAGLQPALPGGKTHRDKHLVTAFFAQHQIDSLQMDLSPIGHFMKLDRSRDVALSTEQELRDFLGGFDFHGDRVFEAVEPFSGGEKARLALALLVWQKPNLLLLDEPTNHLDLDMRRALELALQRFAGAVVMVSHDRHLLAACADELMIVADGACSRFDGDLDDYARWLKQRDRQESIASEIGKTQRVSAKDQRRNAAQARAEQKPLRDKIRAAEREMQKLEVQLAELESVLGDPEFYSREPERAGELARQQGQLSKRLEELEHEWLELSEQLEALQKEL